MATARCGSSKPVAVVSPTWVGTNWFGNADSAFRQQETQFWAEISIFIVVFTLL